MSTTVTAPTAPPRRRLRRIRMFLILLFVALAVPLGYWLVMTWANERALAEAIAETDRLDPRWRFDEIIADRAALADEQNGSVQVRKAKTLCGAMPSKLSDDAFVVLQALQTANPTVPLTPAQTAALREYLERLGPGALAEARALCHLPRGRPQIVYAPDFISTMLAPVQEAREVSLLLHYDVLLRADEGHLDGALHTCRAMLNAGRSIGDEPFLIAVLVRTNCAEATIDAVERVLAQGEPGTAALTEMQAALAQEAAELTVLPALRGERAGYFHVQQLILEGKLKASQVAALQGRRWGPIDRLVGDVLPAQGPLDRAAFLRRANALVEAAKLPVERQAEEFARVPDDRRAVDALAQMPHPWLEQALARHLQAHANLRCAVAALAAERYRRESKGAWPESLEALVKSGLLPTVPRDPYGGAPMRMKHMHGGLVIYSIGPDRGDNSGAIQRIADPPAGTDQGFRLWDAAARGQ